MAFPSFQVHRCGTLEPTRDPFDNDPRGLLWMWEPPSPTATYIMAIDPTVGRVNWHREARVDEDKHTDNTAIEIIRVGNPDIQVAEYAAPIDFGETARLANLLGRAYKGKEEDCCVCIIEHPGPGTAVQQTMLNQYHYYNMWLWKHLDSAVPKPTRSYGFYASNANNRHLWICGSRHIKLGKVAINSPWLVEEMVDSTINPLKGYAEAISGQHDDRLKAILLAVYAAHEWSMEVDFGQQEEAKPIKTPSWQASDLSVDAMYAEWEAKFNEIGEEI